MEVDKKLEEELDYWCKEYPDLTRDEIKEIIEVIDIGDTKEKFWRDNPTLPEEIVDSISATAAHSSYDYHQYRDLNNEAS